MKIFIYTLIGFFIFYRMTSIEALKEEVVMENTENTADFPSLSLAEAQLKLPLISFYFIRHGETDWNKDHRIMGQTDIPLNETGRAQAYKAALLLKNKGIKKIIASPLRRTKETAEIIQKVLGEDIPLFLDPGLMECNWGSLEGRVNNHLPSLHEWALGKTPKGGESVTHFITRISTTMDHLLTQKNILIVSHGGVFWGLTELLEHHPEKTENAIPYYFRAPPKENMPWFIYPLE